MNQWFGGHHLQGEGWFLDTSVEALLRRTTTFDDIEEVATAIATAAHSYARERSLTTLWPRAFPTDTAQSPA